MNNTFRKLFKLLRAWWITLMLFAFIPMVQAQTITNIGVAPAAEYPGEQVTVTLTVTDFVDAEDYNYYVVYNYEDYDMLLEFTHEPDPVDGDVDVTALNVDGDGDITITAVVPADVYRYGNGELTVLVIDNNGDLVYQIGGEVSTYPDPSVDNPYVVGDFDFEGYNEELRFVESPLFYEFDNGSYIYFELVRNNPEPYGTDNEVLVQFKAGTANWTTITTLDLNTDQGAVLINNAHPDWDTDIEDNDIMIRIIQPNSDDIPAGVKTWAVEDFAIGDYLGEPSDFEAIGWGQLNVKDIVDIWLPGVNNFEFSAPEFSITAFNAAGDVLWPGAEIDFEITGGPGEFPAGTIFEIYLTEDDGLGGIAQEIFMGTFPLADLPDDGVPDDFTITLPFRPNVDWILNVRADLRDDFVHEQLIDFQVEQVWFGAVFIDFDEIPAGEQFELDGDDYLYPGSSVYVDYSLGAGQEIYTSDVQVVLEYDAGDGWLEMSRKAYSNTPAQQFITGTIPAAGQIDANNIDFRLRLYYGEDLELFSEADRTEIGNMSNVDELPDGSGVINGTFPLGTNISLSLFVKNTVAQDIILEYRYDGQPVWQVLETIATTATEDGYVVHVAADFFDLVPAGEIEVTDPEIRFRWADGAPAEGNMALFKSGRMQIPYDLYLDVQNNIGNVPILYPYLTLSSNVQGNYIFSAENDSIIELTVDYYHYAMPAGTQIAAVLLEKGNSPLVDPYLYLGSKAIPATGDEDSQTFTIPYADIEATFGALPADELFEEFEIGILATEKDAADPIMFSVEEVDFGWKDGYDAQPVMITSAEDITGYPEPLYLSFDWYVTTPINPWVTQTMPIVQYTTNDGATWTTIEEIELVNFSVAGYTWEIDQVEYPDLLSETTRFRWWQAVELGVWDVDNVKLLSGENNLVTFEYKRTGIPQDGVFLAIAEEEVVVEDPCEDFDAANIGAYEFTTEAITVESGGSFEFDWEFLVNTAKSITVISANDFYVHGENTLEFNIDYIVDTKLEEVKMTFPANVVPDTADDIVVDGNTLTADVTGQVVTWTADAGVIVGAIDLNFNVTFTVASAVTEAIEVAYEITDAAGTMEDVLEIMPGMAFPEGTVFTFEMGGEVIAEVTETGTFTANIPASMLTGAYDIDVTAEYFYYDEVAEDYVSCGQETMTVFYDMFVILVDETPEVYEIELTEVNFIDPDEEYYFGHEVEVEFETFGPWGDFDDARYEVLLTQTVIHEADITWEEDFTSGVFPPAGWQNIGAGALWQYEEGAGYNSAVHYDDFGPQDDWLITSQISLPDGANKLVFENEYVYAPWYGQNYVYLSTTGNDPADFTTLLWNPATIPGGVDIVELDLTPYSGQDIYLAFVYEGDFSHVWYIDRIYIQSGVDEEIFVSHNLGNIPHVEGVTSYEATLALPSFEELEGTEFDLDADGTDFFVEIRAFQGEEGEELVLAEVLYEINDFYLLSGTEDDETPVTFDVLDEYRYAITNKLELEQYEQLDVDVNLQFTYSADILAPNFQTLPVLQVTMDNGVTYTDVEVEGSAFAAQKRLDAQAAGVVYTYSIEADYLTDNTRFRWYQEVPDGEWTIDDISIVLAGNEVPLAEYFIEDSAIEIEVKEYVEPDWCDQFDETSLLAYDWTVEDDEVAGFEAPVYTDEDFEFNFTWNAATGADLGVDEFPESTEYLFYLKRKTSTYKSSEKGHWDNLMKISRNIEDNSDINARVLTDTELNTETPKDFDPDAGLWVEWWEDFTGHAIGLTSGGVISTGMRLLPEHLDEFDGLEITHIQVAQADVGNGAVLIIEQGPSIDNLDVVQTQSFLQFEDSWILIELDEPYVIDASLQVVISVDWDHNAGQYPAFRDVSSYSPGLGDLVKLNDPSGPWNALGNFGPSFESNWNISAFVFGAEGPILLNKDGIPVTMDDAPFTGFIPEDVVTGLYEVEARATIYQDEEEDKNSCGPYVQIVKDDLLVINRDLDAESVLAIDLNGLYIPEAEEEDDNGDDKDDEIKFVDELVVGQLFNAVYTTYGEWPEGMNFAGIIYTADQHEILGTVQLTGNMVEMEDLQMPFIPFEDDDLEFIVVAYEGDELILSDINIDFDMEEDHGLVTEDIITLYGESVKGYDFAANEFNAEGHRYVTTPVMDLTTLDNTKAKIWFRYHNITVSPTAATIPVAQVSTDGGSTWADIELMHHAAQGEDRLYNVDITGYFTETTQFRFIQHTNMGEDKDVWNLTQVSITTGESNVFDMSNVVEITQVVPALLTDYEYELDLGAFDLEPTIYAGDSFDFTFDVVEDGYEYPEGTVFTIQLHQGGDIVVDLETGEEVVLYEGVEVGELTAIAPIVERGTYDIYVIATYFDSKEEGFVYDEDIVGALNIFNPVVRTNFVGLDVPYAGGYADFEGTIESNLDIDLSGDYWYNLILTEGGNERILAVQEGSAEFEDVMLPAFLSGAQNFKIQASIGGPLGEVDDIYETVGDMTKPDWTSAGEGFADGDRLIIGDEFDLEGYGSISFDVKFEEEIENLTEAQHMVFEYSIDGGRTFTTLWTYPDERFNDEEYFNDDDFFEEKDLVLPEEAQIEEAILRFRVQELKGLIEVENFTIHAIRPVQFAPYYALNSEINIALQRVEITGFDATAYCNSSEIEIFYNIRGSFGDDVVLTLWADGAETDLTFNGITEGAGSVFAHAADLDADGEFQMHFRARDDSFQPDYPVINVVGDLSNFVEVVPEIDEDTDVEATNAFTCEAAERSVIITGQQDYFVYQVRNAATLEWMSEAVLFDPEEAATLLNDDGDFEISVGVIEEKTKAEVVVIAQSIDGTLACETMVLDEIVTFEVRDFVLQYSWTDPQIIGSGYYIDLTGEELFAICEEEEDGTSGLALRLLNNSTGDPVGVGDGLTIKWYRDNMETPLYTGTDVGGVLTWFPISGNYFAVVEDDDCDDYFTMEVFVEVVERPEMPIITYVGDYELCEGETGMLVTSDEYAHYLWFKNGDLVGGNQNTLTIYEGGDYEVMVSDRPFDPYASVCHEISDMFTLFLEVVGKPAMPQFTVVNDILCDHGVAQVMLDWPTDDDVWYQLYVVETGEPTGLARLGNNANIILESDTLTQDVHLGVMAWHMDIDVCDPTLSTQIEKVHVQELTIIVSGNTLMASIDWYHAVNNPNGAVSYQWYRNGDMILNGGNGRTINIYDDAEYTVVVETFGGCVLESTLGKDNEVDPGDADALSFNIFPNPVQDELTVSLNGITGDVQVRIISIAGEIVQEMTLNINEESVEEIINVENLNTGIYMIQIVGSDHTEVKRFIKQ